MSMSKKTFREILLNSKPLQEWISILSDDRVLYIQEDGSVEFITRDNSPYIEYKVSVSFDFDEIFYRKSYAFERVIDWIKRRSTSTITIISCVSGRKLKLNKVNIDNCWISVQETQGNWYMEIDSINKGGDK